LPLFNKCPAIRNKYGSWSKSYKIYGEFFETVSKRVEGYGEVSIYLPKNYSNTGKKNPLLIGLPGWKAKAIDWINNAKITEFAEKYNFVVVLPEMWTTAYETMYFPETNASFKWGTIPGTVWIGEVLIPFLKNKLNIDDTGKKTGIFGLSTGGRGAIYVAERYPEYFRACVSMSGDFDRVKLLEWTRERELNIMGYDPPSVTIYGNPYNLDGTRNEKILSRWKYVDNPCLKENIEKLKKNGISAYLLHGKNDRVVDSMMSKVLFESAQIEFPGIDIIYEETEGYGHEWNYWGQYCLPKAMIFFINRLSL